MKIEVLPGHSVLTPDGSYSPGQGLDLIEAEARRLIAAGIVKPAAALDEPAPKPNAPETVKLVEAAASLEELDQLAAGDERKTVVAAIAKRRQELTAATADK